METPKILIVDDDEAVREMLKDFFTSKGYDVEVKSRGDEALDAIKRYSFDLALVDIKMPGMDGITLLNMIKKMHEELPVIIITGYADMDNIMAALKGGAFDFKRKPLNLEGLHFTAEEAIRKGKLIRENKKLIDELREANKNLNRILTEKTESLVKEKSRLESMIEGMNEAIIFCDKNDNVIDINKYALDLFNVKREDIVGRSVYACHKKETYPIVNRILDTVKMDKGKNNIEIDSNIGGRWFNLRFSAIRDESGSYHGTVANFIDITDRKMMQSQMAMTEKLASIGGLTAGMTHEILNPLNIISGNVQIKLMEKGAPAGDRKIYEIIQKQVERITGIIEGLLRFSKQREPKMEEIDINAVIERVISLLEYEFKLQNIIVRKDIDKNIPPIITDADQLEQVLMTILSNARDALNERELKDGIGSLERLHWKKEIRIIASGCGQMGKDAVISISDTGGGIPNNIMAKIFDPFFTTKPEGKGTGLGLSIAHGIIDGLGGRIDVKSEVGKGTTFSILLPCSSERLKKL